MIQPHHLHTHGPEPLYFGKDAIVKYFEYPYETRYMRKFSWYTTPVKVGQCTVYKYAVDRYIPNRVNRSGFGSYIHVMAGTYVTAHDGGWERCKPNLKGGHRYNHIYNVCHRITFRSKSARHRVSREDKRFFTATFYTTLKLNPQVLGDILKRRKGK